VKPKERHFVHILGFALPVVYVVMVAGLALWKATSMPQSDRLSWAEVVYGPAITIVSYFLLFLAGIGIDHLISSRKCKK